MFIVYFPFNSFKYLMLLFRNKCQPAVAYKVLCTNNHVMFGSLLNMTK